jgi:hypothetical protein
MPWRTIELREQRVRFVVAAHRQEKPVAELCREFGISLPVGYEGATLSGGRSGSEERLTALR